MRAAPENTEAAFWYALALARTRSGRRRGRCSRGSRIVEPRWGELLRRLPAAGLFPDDPALIERLLAE